MVILKVVAVVLLWAILYTLTPTFGGRVIDGLVPIMLAIASYALVFWIPLPRRQKPAPLDSAIRG